METKICVVGLGYVGLPLALTLAKHYPLVGFDVNQQRIRQLEDNNDSSGEVSFVELSSSSMRFSFDPAVIKDVNFVIICVPTPIDGKNEPDLSYLKSASKLVGENLSAGTVVVYESTVYPGVTRDECCPILEESSGLVCGEDFKVGYSPERMNPGDKNRTVDKIVKVVSAMDEESLDRVSEIYGSITQIHKAPSIEVAEAAKVIENIQRDLNIALMNELAVIFDKSGIDVHEVIKAAGTKWNFHKYHPGLVGGHCFDKNSTVFLTNSNKQKIKKIGPYIDSLHCRKEVHNGVEVFYPDNVKILSFDMEKNVTIFKPVTMASKRKSNELLRLIGAYNYCLEVTDKHPVIVHNGKLKIKFAKDVKIGDSIVLNKDLPSKKRSHVIDVIEHLNTNFIKKIRVKIKGRKMSDFRDIINKSFPGKKGNYYNWNFLPLDKFLTIEKKLGVRRTDIYLCTGRGPSFSEFPAIFKTNNDFFRLIGYYLSEGCITDDRSLRVRFTFHKNEKEYIDDVKNILKSFEIKWSIYHDKTYKATVIKVSSSLFGFLLRDILQCGVNCYSMQIPEMFLDLNKKAKEELLKGLFRGDGGVTLYNKNRTYRKNGKVYTHANNSIEINYFTSSPKLFQQVVLFLLNQGLVPRLAKRKGLLTLTGYTDVKRIENWFLGDKKRKLDSYLRNLQKKITYQKEKRFPGYVAIKIEKIEKKKTDYVYSLEVEDNHTLITSNGIIAHNCIGVDPYYLTYKAKKLGYDPQVILAGRRINDTMHSYYADKIEKKLDGRAKVLILGLTFKPNVPDYRNSRVKHLIQDLKSRGIEVEAYDPYISDAVVEGYFGATPSGLGRNDVPLVFLAVDHKKFEGVENRLGEGAEIMRLREL